MAKHIAILALLTLPAIATPAANGVWSLDETIVETCPTAPSTCASNSGPAIDVRLGPTTLSAAGTLTRRP
jgi:hypothetical protein